MALATCEFLRRLGSARLPASRFVTIDGLRGYLAFFVFLHHSSIWYYYLKDGLWQLPPSRLYAHFGQTSVALFFMVTGFLFAHKLLHSRGTPIRWLDVYASRIARLLPAYLLAMALLFLLVFTATGFSLREAPSALLGKVLDWLLFSIPSKPDMNGFIGTFRIVAGVTWTLPYEWLFYFCLPFLGVLLGNRPSPVAMAIMAGMIWLVLKAWQPNWTLAYMFVAGWGVSARGTLDAPAAIRREYSRQSPMPGAPAPTRSALSQRLSGNGDPHSRPGFPADCGGFEPIRPADSSTVPLPRRNDLQHVSAARGASYSSASNC